MHPIPVANRGSATGKKWYIAASEKGHLVLVKMMVTLKKLFCIIITKQNLLKKATTLFL
jgi:hypothetical protein